MKKSLKIFLLIIGGLFVLAIVKSGLTTLNYQIKSTQFAPQNSQQSDSLQNINRPAEPIKTYTNTAGSTIQSPTHYSSAPAGATAQCRDGSFSFSQSRRGTCSHHGGVAQWISI